MSDPVCTLVHISDPHFGSGFVVDGEARWRRFVSRVPGLRHIAGMFPHGYQSAVAAAVAVRQILRDRKARGISAVVVHTGDLTAAGHHAEFSVGITFMRHGHYLENGTMAGLRLDTEFGQQVFDMPGNHDLWRRRSPKDHEAFSSHYGGSYPKSREITSPSGTALIYGLDSNRSSLFQHRLANGEIPFESINSLLGCLRAKKNTDALQVVCLHHPLFLRRRGAPQILGTEILKLRNRVAVARALADAGAHLVLAGHVHQQQHSGRYGFQHFIAGSLCQVNARPSFWLLDLYSNYVEYIYYHIPNGKIHFEPALSRSGRAKLRESVC